MATRRPLFKRQILLYILTALIVTPFLSLSIVLTKKQSRALDLLANNNNNNNTTAPLLMGKSKRTFFSSSISTKNNKRKLPSLRNGGVVLLFHNPKTGGTSVRQVMQSHPSIHYITRQHTSIDDLYKKMHTYTTSPSNKIYFVEIHGQGPGFIELLPKLHEWKRQAALYHVPFFVFSMMRDPIDWLLSCFNFFCLSIQKHTKCTSPPTIDGLLKEARPNPQSRWYCFMNTIMAVPNQVEINMSQCTLETLLPSMYQYMDWVGTVEKYDETLAVLQHVLPSNITATFQRKNKTRRNPVRRNMLNETTTMYLKNNMSQDYDLYRRLQQTYRMDEMELPNNKDAGSGKEATTKTKAS